MRTLLIIVIVAIAAAGGWYMGRHGASGDSGSQGRKVAFYQSPMHPWIKSDKPGACTICGMKLTPIYEGEKGFEQSADIVSLSSNTINVLNVQVDPVSRRRLERQLAVAGRIESDETRIRVISAYVDGRVDKLFVNFTGAEVKAGEPLAMLYSPTLLTAEREYLSVLSQTNFASATLHAQHERLIGAAQDRLRRLGLTDEQIASLRPDALTNFTTQIVAPIGGTVITRAVLEGQYVKEGDKLFEIADLSSMWFRFDVYEQDLPLVQLGGTVRVSSPALGSKAFEGRIVFVEPSINQESRSARVRVELENPIVESKGISRRELFNGLYAEGLISIQTEEVLAVAKSAVIHPGDEARVFVDQGEGAYEHRTVKVGRQGADFVEVLDGLTEGEKVVTSGNLLLDSQVQLNRTASSAATKETHAPVTNAAPHQHGGSEAVQVQLSSQQLTASAEFFKSLLFPSAETLAADDLVKYNEVITHAEHAATEFAAAFPADSPLHPLLQKVVAESKNLKGASDLAAARTAFNPFSKAAVDFHRAVAPTNRDLQAVIYKCPMFPKIGQNAFWLQAKPPLRNPFFGSEMLECGVEVKL